MERNQKTLPLLILLPLLPIFRSDKCSNLPDNFKCYTDYNQTITCMWNSTYMSDRMDTVCNIDAEKISSTPYRASCQLEPVDISKPALKKCSLIFGMTYRFVSMDNLSLRLNCNQNVTMSSNFKPCCHIKVNPPGRPDVNITTVSWLAAVTKHARIKSYDSELQWKRQDQSWSDPAVQTKSGPQCENDCETELDPDLLIQGDRYEARVRVRSIVRDHKGAWSDWSHAASWVSPVGKIKPPTGIAVGVVCMIVGGVMALLAVIIFSTCKTKWIYILKKIRGPPLPDPGKSFLQDLQLQSWLSSHFANESFHSFFKPVDIITVELTSAVDAVTPSTPSTNKMMKMMMVNGVNYDSTSSSFSNPNYTGICTPPVSSLTAGNLKPCMADTPYGPVGTQSEEKRAEQDSDKLRELFLKGSSNSEQVQLISEYEKTEKLPIDRLRLQSLDSGMCSCEEVSEDSMEADSINSQDSHDSHEPDGEEEKEGGHEKKIALPKLFESIGGTFGKAMQVCSDYERVEKLQADSPELPSLDSGVGSGGEEQASLEESMEDVDKATESTRFLFPPHPSSALPCSLLSFPKLPLNFPGPGLGPALQFGPSHILEGIALMSTGRSVEPSGDGYMPVKQEES